MPRADTIARRWSDSVRGECIDRVFITGQRHVRHVLAEWMIITTLTDRIEV